MRPNGPTEPPPDALPSVTLATWAELVSGSTTPVLVDFGADWCTPCRLIRPVLGELAAAYAGRLVVFSVDTDAEQDLAAAYGIQSIPTLMFFRSGALLRSLVGALPKRAIADVIDEVLATPLPST